MVSLGGEKRIDVRFRALPLPEIVGSRKSTIVHTAERNMFNAVLQPGRWPIVQCNLQQDYLHPDRDNGLDQKRKRVESAEPVEDPSKSC